MSVSELGVMIVGYEEGLLNDVVDLLNPNWLGVLVGVVGLVFGIYQIFKKTGPALVAQYAGQRLIDAPAEGVFPSDLEVRFKGSVVPRVSATTVVVWNAGHAPVRAEDVVKDDSIRIVMAEPAQILQAEVTKYTRAVNGVSVRAQENVVALDFKFLDRNDGAVIRILHTSESTVPSLHGSVIGMPQGIQLIGRMRDYSLQTQRRRLTSSPALLLMDAMYQYRHVAFTVSSIFGFLVLAKAILPQLLVPWTPVVSGFERFVLALFGVAYGLPPAMLLWLERRRFPRQLDPSDHVPEGERAPSMAGESLRTGALG